jgi:hypothetical protein
MEQCEFDDEEEGKFRAEMQLVAEDNLNNTTHNQSYMYCL